jgi:hypothetical protein
MDTAACLARLTLRAHDVAALYDRIERGECCSVVGVSNIGKSALLRSLARCDLVAARFGEAAARYAPIYVDLNRMLYPSEQGLYELVLRCFREWLVDHPEAATPELSRLLDKAYADVVQPNSAFAVPLAFNRGVTAVAEAAERRVCLLLDEFDDPLARLEGRVFLNLRALRDQFSDRLSYITATDRRLVLIRAGDDVGVEELYELFAAREHHVRPLEHGDALRFVRQIAQGANLGLPEDWLQQIVAQVGGHPGLLEAAAYRAARVSAEPGRDVAARLAALPEALTADETVRGECLKLWEDLALGERQALDELVRTGTAQLSGALQSLMRKGLLAVAPPTDGAPGLVPFAPIWSHHVAWQHEARRPSSMGVRMDVQTNEVWVDGTPAPYLTPLESRLLMMLYGHLGRPCTKEAIVEAVYGREYIPEDDPALQRLVRRLREKIEPDAANPTYLLSVRGFGYKLVNPESQS